MAVPNPGFSETDLFDLEQEIGLLGDLIQVAPSNIRFQGLIGRFLQNLRAWIANVRESKFVAFDNLGLSGAQPYDVYTRTTKWYASNYAPVFSTSKTMLAGAVLNTTDQQIAAANAKIEQFNSLINWSSDQV